MSQLTDEERKRIIKHVLKHLRELEEFRMNRPNLNNAELAIYARESGKEDLAEIFELMDEIERA